MKKFKRYIIKLGMLIIFLLMGFIVLTGLTHKTERQSDEWVAPKSADQLKNPYKGNAEATAEGKKLYVKFCKICHGDKGRGDGIAGINLKPRPRDFTSEKLREQTDGAIFWKMNTGKPPMAAYEKILKEEQRWQLVNYIKELGKK